MKRTIYLLAILAALLPGCKDEEPPPPEDPCAAYAVTGLSIGISSQANCGSLVGSCQCDFTDTLPIGAMLRFSPDGNSNLYERYEWKLGTEIDRRETESFNVYFEGEHIGPLWVTLYAFRKQDNGCVSIQEGACDTVTKMFVIAADTAHAIANPVGIPLTTLFHYKGRWVGTSDESPGEVDTVLIYIHRNAYYPGSYDEYVLEGLPTTCPGRIIRLGYSCFDRFFGLLPYGGGGLSCIYRTVAGSHLYGHCPTHDSIVVNYRRDSLATPLYTFVGHRIN